MNINFVKVGSPSKKDKRVSIVCRITKTGKDSAYKVISVATGLRVPVKYWNVKRQEQKAGTDGAFQTNKRIDEIKQEIRTFYDNSLREEKTDFEFFQENFRRIIKGEEIDKPKKVYSFQEAFDEFLYTQRPLWAVNTRKKFTTLNSYLQDFASKKRFVLSFSNLDESFYGKFLVYLLEDRDLSTNHVARTIRFLKTFLFWATKRKYNTNESFKGFKPPTMQTTDVVSLEKSELIAYLRYDFGTAHYLARVRDVFCFGCLTGQRFSDLRGLTFDAIRGKTWDVRTQKTNDIIEVPLTDEALEILSRYKASGKLPVISNQKFNKYLQEGAQRAGLNRPCRKTTFKGNQRQDEMKPLYSMLGSHSARRTFCTLSMKQGMRLGAIQKITGHTSIKQLENYIGKSSDTVKTEFYAAWGNENLRLVVNDR